MAQVSMIMEAHAVFQHVETLLECLRLMDLTNAAQSIGVARSRQY